MEVNKEKPAPGAKPEKARDVPCVFVAPQHKPCCDAATQSEEQAEGGPHLEDMFTQLDKHDAAAAASKKMALQLVADHCVEEEQASSASPMMENALLHVVLASLQHAPPTHLAAPAPLGELRDLRPASSTQPNATVAATASPPTHLAAPAPLGELRDLRPASSTQPNATVAAPATRSVGVATTVASEPPSPVSAATRTIERAVAALDQLTVVSDAVGPTTLFMATSPPYSRALPATPPTPASCASSDDHQPISPDRSDHHDEMGATTQLLYSAVHPQHEHSPPTTPPSPSSVASSIDLRLAFHDFLPDVLKQAQPASTCDTTVRVSAWVGSASESAPVARRTTAPWAGVVDERTRGLRPALAAPAPAPPFQQHAIHFPDHGSTSPVTAAASRSDTRCDTLARSALGRMEHSC
jgi:hypothetical protein